jgi:hypothetical protein
MTAEAADTWKRLESTQQRQKRLQNQCETGRIEQQGEQRQERHVVKGGI